MQAKTYASNLEMLLMMLKMLLTYGNSIAGRRCIDWRIQKKGQDAKFQHENGVSTQVMPL